MTAIKIKERLRMLDALRGIALINMIVYHALWDVVYIMGIDIPWYHSIWAHIWQQCICCTFIFLSGFCHRLGSKPLKRGLTVFTAGAVVTAVTLVFTPEDRVVFGVLTLIGSCMLLMIPIGKALGKCPPTLGLCVSLALFVLTKNIDYGYLGFAGFHPLLLPRAMYANYVTAFFGFPHSGFYSTDYFPLLPWLFLFAAGYFLYGVFEKHDKLDCFNIFNFGKKSVLEWFGRHSLIIYMLHQPILYFLFICIGKLF